MEGLSAEELALFLAELDEHMQALDEDLLRMEEVGIEPELLNRVFRAAHTLKGSAGLAGVVPMAQLAHAMEEVLDYLRQGQLSLTSEVVSSLLASLDKLREMREAIVGGTSLPSSDDLVASLRRMLGSPKRVDHQLTALERASIEVYLSEGRRLYKVAARVSRDSSFVAARQLQLCLEAMARGELVASIPSLDDIESQKVGHALVMYVATDLAPEDLREALKQVDEIDELSIEAVKAAEANTGAGEGAPDGHEAVPISPRGDNLDRPARLARTVRIDLERLDNLMNLVGELVILRTRLSRIGAQIAEEMGSDGTAGDLLDAATQMARVTEELHLEVTRSRMVPIGTVFSKFPRMVRDLAIKSGKKVDLVIEGQETELDRTVIEGVGDPLIHLLRNAVDHGIEPPEVRSAAGKPERGTIRLVACHEEGQIVIRVEDDGRGIDVEQVRKTALVKGLINPEMAQRMGRDELLDLVFRPGFSTASKVTEVSGRGVGMDVVRSNIERLNGTVSLHSEPGRGTEVELRLPLTLAIVNALLVSAKDTTYAIPLTAVREVMKIPVDALHYFGGRLITDYRGATLPLVDLDDLLHGRPTVHLRDREVWIVVMNLGGRQLAMKVDALIGNQEVVIKSLDVPLTHMSCVSGATILEDGTVGLILDAGSILRTAAMTAEPKAMEVVRC